MTSRERIVGVDVARGIALIGMFVAHVDPSRDFALSDPLSWVHIAEGRSANLFVLIAGISLALMTGRNHPRTGYALNSDRAVLIGRAVVLFAIGSMLAWLGTPVNVILEYYAAYFVLGVLVLGYSRVALLVIAAFLTAFGGIALQYVAATAPGLTMSGIGRLLFSQAGYPALTWFAFVAVGIALGRSDFTRTKAAWSLVVGGAVLAIAGKLAGDAAQSAISVPQTLLPNQSFNEILNYSILSALGSDSREVSPFIMLSTMGSALAVLGACLVVARYAPWICRPFASVGRMALTMYAVHIVALSFVMNTTAYQSGVFLWPFIIGALILATGWLLLFKQGPLEWFMRAGVDAVVGTRSRSAKATSAAR